MAAKKTASAALAEAKPASKPPRTPRVECIVILRTRDGFGLRGELRNFAEATLKELGVRRGEDYRPATEADRAIGRIAR